MKRLGIISGGSGSSKFATAFAHCSKLSNNYDIGFIVNVGDNYWHHGLYVCPDVDIILHALSGELNTDRGWGVVSDSFDNCEVFSKLSANEWFKLGSIDSAYCQRRTELMLKGWKISSITKLFCDRLGIVWPVIPASDDNVTTFVRTNAGLMHLQEYWVKHRAFPEASEIIYIGQDAASANANTIEYLRDLTLIFPANPVTSIMPTAGIRQVKKTLKRSNVVAISPFVGTKVFSGPAAKMMAVIGEEPSSLGVAKMYSSFLRLLVVDIAEDLLLVRKIKDLGVECHRTNIRLDNESRKTMPEEIMNIL